MPFASEARGLRLFIALCLSSLAVAIAAQPAQAATVVPKSGETRLEVSIPAFIKLLNNGIFATAIAPARLEYGAAPAAIFPARNIGLFDASLNTATVPHEGGLRIEKASIGMVIDATNVTITCLPVAGCRVLNTANNLLPNELAELRDVTISDDGNGTATVVGRAVIGPVTSLALNTLFQTQAFENGMELGMLRSTLQY
jgi:hypothetical protein